MHLDTHVVVWLHEDRRDRIPEAVRRRLNTAPLMVSPMVELELAYLFDVGKISVPASVIIDDLRPTVGLAVSTTPFESVIRQAVRLTWTRDPFDRLIAAQAIAEGESLLTANRRILANLQHAVWDKTEPSPA